MDFDNDLFYLLLFFIIYYILKSNYIKIKSKHINHSFHFLHKFYSSISYYSSYSFTVYFLVKFYN